MPAKFLIPLACILCLGGAALASDYTTPEYSGPSARIESSGLGNSAQSAFPRSGPLPRAGMGDDTGYERNIGVRHDRIMREMDLREEKRKSEDARNLYLNE